MGPAEPPDLSFDVTIDPLVTPPVNLPISATVTLPPSVHEIETGNNTADTVISVQQTHIDLVLTTSSSVSSLVPGEPTQTAIFTPV